MRASLLPHRPDRNPILNAAVRKVSADRGVAICVNPASRLKMECNGIHNQAGVARARTLRP